jgi:hypothetical protein
MFEVLEVGRPGWFTKPVKFKALSDMQTELFATRSGARDRYLVAFKAGETFTLLYPREALIAAGDRASIEALAGSGRLRRYARYQDSVALPRVDRDDTTHALSE